MARLVGVDLPREKRVEVALTYIFGMGPEAMITIKRDEIIDYVAERLGIPARLLTTQDEREQIAQQAAQVQMAAQQQPMQPQQAGNQEALMRAMQ